MIHTEVTRMRFKDLLKQVESAVIADSANFRLKVIDLIRAELDVLADGIERGRSEDRNTSRVAIARAVALLLEIDRDSYREDL